MHKHNLYIQTPKEIGKIYDGLLQTASSADYDQLTVTVAYASRKGCVCLVKGLRSRLAKWKRMKKRWLISFDLGITEPDALVFLSSLPNSTVRIANAEAALEAQLRPQIHFHSKLYLFECRYDAQNMAMFSTSANLTMNGLYFNNEQATSSVWSPCLDESDNLEVENIQQQKRIIDRMFEEASLLSSSLLKRYRLLWRPKKTAEVEGKIAEKIFKRESVIDLPQAIALALASSFWVRVTRKVVENLGEGNPGNQVDLHRGSRVFFGFPVSQVPQNTVFGPVRIRFKGKIYDCSMRYGDNSMDKINLPVLKSPQTYAKQTLLFKRAENGIYKLCIGSKKQAVEWRKLSKKQKGLYSMKSGRQYGVFD